MELLKLIFYKIYCWQRRFGSGYTIWDTIIGLSATLTVLFTALCFFVMSLVGRGNLASVNAKCFIYFFFAINISFPLALTVVLLPRKRRFKILYQIHRQYRDKYKWLALSVIVFPLFLLFFAVMLFVQKLNN